MNDIKNSKQYWNGEPRARKKTKISLIQLTQNSGSISMKSIFIFGFLILLLKSYNKHRNKTS